MNRFRRLFVCTLVLLVCHLCVIAQSLLNVRGTVFDLQSLHTLPGATVRLLDAKDSLLLGAITTESGQYLLPGVKGGETYTLQVSFVGYKTQSLTLKLPQKTGNFKASDVLMREDSKMLQEMVVTAKAVEMTVVEDTLVYNASAFMLTEGAVVEELIKKLPGVTQDENGNYLVNGRQVSQILVDGKEFFGNNQELVLKNLPAEIVDKVKAYDKQSDLARITGIDDGNERTVLDLTIKKDRKRGWFGNVDAGIGTEERYSGRTMLNRFRGDQKFSVVGNAGNTGGNGTQSNQHGGFTLQNTFGKVELNGGVNGNFTQSDRWNTSNRQSFENTRAAYSNSASSNQGWNRSVNFNFKMEWKPDSMTNIIFRPSGSLSSNTSRSESESASFSDDPYTVVDDPLAQYDDIVRDIRVNHNFNNNHNANRSWNANASLQVNRRLGKPGRNLTLNLDGGGGNQTGNGESYSQIDYYKVLAENGGDSVYHKIQYNDTGNKSYNWGGRLSYTEPVGFKMYLQFSYNFRYQWQDQDRTVASVFDPWFANFGAMDYRATYRDYESYATPDREQCRYVENHNYNHDARAQLRINRTRWNMTVGVNARPMTNRTEYDKGYKHYDLSRTVCNWAPTLNYRFRFSRHEQLELRYGGNTSQPGITQLIPDTLSNANPLNISLGNPNLVPSFTHQLRGSYRRFVQDLQRSFSLDANYNATQNAVANRTEYNEETGGRVTRPENINGNWNAGGNFKFSTAFMADTRFRMNMGTRINHTNHVEYVYHAPNKREGTEAETVKNNTGSTNIGQNLRFTFHNDYLEVNINGGATYNRSRATASAAANLDTWRFNYGGSVILNLPWNMQFSTDINQHSRRGYADRSMNTNELLWNLGISQSFLKGKAATVSLRWHDVLNRRDDVSRSVSATSRTDSRSSLISSYAMLHFTYRFNFFNGKGGRGGFRPDRPFGDGGEMERPQNGGERPRGGAGERPRGGGEGSRGGGGRSRAGI